MPVAFIGFEFFSKKVDVDLPLDEKIVPGKFHQDRLHGVETYSEQTNKQTNFLLLYIQVTLVCGLAQLFLVEVVFLAEQHTYHRQDQ